MPKGDFKIPTGLTRLGRRAAMTIEAVLRSDGCLDTGGCKALYTPQQWKDRGETSGAGSVLIVVYDGGDHYHHFSYMTEVPKRKQKMSEALGAIRCYAESINGWSAAIYEL